MEFRLLGPLAVIDPVLSTPTALKPRKVLALLLTHANRPVPISMFIEELWGERPPASAVRTLQTYIFQLRRHFSASGGWGGCPDKGLAERRLISTGTSSYLLPLDEGQLDIQEFRRLSRLGRAALRDDQPQRASQLLTQALSLWRGPALVDVCPGRPLKMQAVQLEEDRLAVLERRIDADLRAGCAYHELVGELSSLVVEHPYNEGIWHRLMEVLCLAGRRSEAITAYHRLRSQLVDEFGMEPSRELQELYQRVLCDDLTESLVVRAPAVGRL